ncbi:MAG: hypothetical protein CM15mP18_0460 [Methanobacteriota archaeon]|nr:MAG: hypothetical protein CM15mP18_0460 [Euryarchaeota archaeon]
MKVEDEAHLWRGVARKLSRRPSRSHGPRGRHRIRPPHDLDGHLVLHHDRTPMIPRHEKKDDRRTWKRGPWTNSASSAPKPSTRCSLIPSFQTAWREQAKVGVIEIKRPHPKHIGRGWWNDDRRALLAHVRADATGKRPPQRSRHSFAKTVLIPSPTGGMGTSSDPGVGPPPWSRCPQTLFRPTAAAQHSAGRGPPFRPQPLFLPAWSAPTAWVHP